MERRRRKRMYIPLSEDEDFELGNVGPKYCNRIILSLVMADRKAKIPKKGSCKGIEKKFYIIRDGARFYSRFYIAQDMGANPGHISRAISSIKNRGNSLRTNVLDSETDSRGIRFHRIDYEKVANCIIWVFESLFKDLNEDEKRLVRNIVASQIEYPRVFLKSPENDEIYFTLLESLYSWMSEGVVLDEVDEEDFKALSSLYQKLFENQNCY